MTLDGFFHLVSGIALLLWAIVMFFMGMRCKAFENAVYKLMREVHRNHPRFQCTDRTGCCELCPFGKQRNTNDRHNSSGVVTNCGSQDSFACDSSRMKSES